MHGEFHIFSNFVNGFDWRIETTNRLQIVGITFHLLHCLLVVPIMQMIGTTFHHLLDRQKHTCRPSRQHRSEGIQATAGQRFAGSSRTRPTQPSPGGFCMSKNQRTVCQCQLSRPPISQKYPANSHENSQNYQYRQPAKAKNTLRRSEKNHAFQPSTMFTFGDDDDDDYCENDDDNEDDNAFHP